MAQQPYDLELYDRLNNKTFHGLLIAEFLAAFNDQCIHAAAMFFAITTGTLRESTAIILMPLLFYTPWAIFAPLAGYFADRLSKRTSLIFWKVAEIGITGIALLGFWLGRLDKTLGTGEYQFLVDLGPWLVMSAVFLMGTHSTFYVPNKYGVLPEIFTVRMLSKANGLIESTTFLAVILGTATGGILMYVFSEREYYLGLVLVVLAVIGTVTSYFIRRMPPADPDRPFPGWLPWHMFRPIIQSVVILARSRMASVAILGLAFYVFILVYMRASMYMFGESRNPPWTELEISLMVAVVSLGIGIGSPLAGSLSGGKVELGLVVIGGIGMIVSLVLAGINIFSLQVLVVVIALIGLFSSFYLVPLYSLLQYSAPKGTKGQSVATNNFICNVGATLATGVLFLIIQATQTVGLVEPFELRQLGEGTLTELKGTRHHPSAVEVQFNEPGKRPLVWHHPEPTGTPLEKTLKALLPAILGEEQKVVIRLDDSVENPQVRVGDQLKQREVKVAVSHYTLRGTDYYHVRPAYQKDAAGDDVAVPPPALFNNEVVPRFLFFAAATMMLIVLVLLILRLPDFFLRSYIFLRSFVRPLPRAAGTERVPFHHAVLVMSCATLRDSLAVLSGVVRPLRLILPEKDGSAGSPPLLRLLARGAGALFVRPEATAADLEQVARKADLYLQKGYVLAISSGLADGQLEVILSGVYQDRTVTLFPVHCAEAPAHGSGRAGVQIGEPIAAGTPAAEILREVQGVADLRGD